MPCGLTGWAQVHGLRGDTSIDQRARFDNFYIENWSFWLDIKIILRTAVSVFTPTGLVSTANSSLHHHLTLVKGEPPCTDPTTTTDYNPADIPVVILCGGMGTRLREASEKLPKPLVDIGGKPILWHIMKTYGHFGFRRFVLCLGYKGDQIRRYFLDYREHANDFTLELGTDAPPQFHGSAAPSRTGRSPSSRPAC